MLWVGGEEALLARKGRACREKTSVSPRARNRTCHEKGVGRSILLNARGWEKTPFYK